MGGTKEHLALPKGVLERLEPDSAWRGTMRAPSCSTEDLGWPPRNSLALCKWWRFPTNPSLFGNSSQ